MNARSLALATALLSLPMLAAAQAPAVAQDDNATNAATWNNEQASKIVGQVIHKLRSLPYYSVFDSISFAVQGRTIVLHGYASRPVVKADAGNAVKSIAGVESVDNQIEVLPPSPMDDRIRAAVYRRIYTQPALRKYTGSPVGFGRFPSVARVAGGITQDPPLGYHAIHIIVKNGHVILTGVVDNETDASIAGIQANSVSGVFSVDNDIMVQGSTKAASK